MAEELVRNPWGVIVRDGELLELRWLPSTATMNDGGFMATLCLFAWEAERRRPRGLLIDAREFRHRFGDDVMTWRDAHIIPPYCAAGGREFAVVQPPGVPEAGRRAVEGPAVFQTNCFLGRDEALPWIRWS